MPQFGFYPTQIFWFIVSFGILFISVRYFLLPPVERVIKEREEKIENMLNNAEALSAEAEKLEKKYQKELDRTTQRSAKMLQQVHEEIAQKQVEKEEALLDVLQVNIQKVKNNLKSREHAVLKNMEVISKDFIQSVCRVFYGFDLPEKELKKGLKRRIKEIENVD